MRSIEEIYSIISTSGSKLEEFIRTYDFGSSVMATWRYKGTIFSVVHRNGVLYSITQYARQ